MGPGLKPAGVSCPHANATGCRIYGRRPQACVDFRCVWLEDTTWPDLWRPDRSGLLCLKAELEENLAAAAVYEIGADVLQTPTATDLLQNLKQSTALMVIINAQQQRRQIRGDCWAMPPGPAVPAPHSKFRAKIGTLESRQINV